MILFGRVCKHNMPDLSILHSYVSFNCSLVEKKRGEAYEKCNSELELHVLFSYSFFNKLCKGRGGTMTPFKQMLPVLVSVLILVDKRCCIR